MSPDLQPRHLLRCYSLNSNRVIATSSLPAASSRTHLVVAPVTIVISPPCILLYCRRQRLILLLPHLPTAPICQSFSSSLSSHGIANVRPNAETISDAGGRPRICCDLDPSLSRSSAFILSFVKKKKKKKKKKKRKKKKKKTPFLKPCDDPTAQHSTAQHSTAHCCPNLNGHRVHPT
ncbi:hypothetical protein BHM03_00010003 [Ensete ventricosum]|nr:hypothetical protein BHM03_00010003 [Ensete ventricosum]